MDDLVTFHSIGGSRYFDEKIVEEDGEIGKEAILIYMLKILG